MIPGITAFRRFAGGGPSGPGDELYDQVVSLLHFNGADASTTFTDQKGITWTAAGNAQIDDTQALFGQALRVDGTGDYITATSAGFAWGTGDYAIEASVRFAARSGNNFVFTFGGGWGVYTFSGQWAVFDGVSNNPILGGTAVNDTWYRLLLTRRNGVLYFFVNGTLIGSAAHTTNHTDTSIRIGAQLSGSGTMNGWVDEFRATAWAREIAAYTPVAAPFPDRLGDPLFETIRALLHFDGTNGSTTLTDELGHTFTANGTAALSTAQSRFGTASLSLPGSGTAYVHAATHADFSVLTGPYCIEFYMRFNSVSGTQCVMDMRPFSARGAGPMFTLASGQWRIYLNGTYRVQVSSPTPAINTWYHFCICRDDSDVTRVFMDGVQIGSNYTDTLSYPATQPIILGRFSDSGSFPMDGYIDEYRLSIGAGAARRIANFAPPPRFADSL